MRIALVFALFCLVAAKHHRHRVPSIDLRGADQLTGEIREDERILNTVPDLAIAPETGPVCEYVVTSSEGLIPFDIEVIDRYSGAAIIKVKDAVSLDCKKKEYKLKVQAIRCDDDDSRSAPVTLSVTVKDTNDHSPEFDSPWYTFTVEEGKIHKEIATLKATDADCGDPFGEICEYKITNGLKDLPFTINNQGVLSNTLPLNYTQTKSYILTVVAIDCGQRQSKSSLVTLNIKESCVLGIHNVNDRISYNPGSGSKLLLPDVTTSVCEKEMSCDVESVTSTIELKAGHVTSGCSRDGMYTNQTIRNCGLSSNSVALLDNNDIRTVDHSGKDQSDGMKFDGTTNAVVVPHNKLPEIIPDTFALSFSMKHGRGTKEQRNNKQNILCETDDFGMNRHHFSVYVRHCKLEVVLRRESGATAEFRAAEWRWEMPQVCDDEWHSYSLLFNGVDDVHVVVDGEAFKADDRNPEILDDWPLHSTKKRQTKLVVGACWHGRQKQMAQFFNGQLDAMHIVVGAIESTNAIACAHKCPEQIQYTGNDVLGEDESATFSPGHSTLTLKAKTAKDLSHMFNMVAYTNTQVSPNPGHRSFIISTKAKCTSGRVIELPESKGYVFVQKKSEPVLSISGSALVEADHHQVKIGTPMIPDINIVVSQSDNEGVVSDISSSVRLDYCKVHLKPSRDMDLEYFSSPASLIASLEIDFEHDKEGIMLRGSETVKGYLDVLSKVHYFNTRPDTYSKRIYSVQCAMLKGKVLSNEFVVTMTIVPSPSEAASILPLDASDENIDSLDMMERHFEPAFDQLGSSRLQNILEMDLPRPKALMSHHGYDVGQGAVAGGAVAVVVVVCVGFLLVLLVVGVLKMRDSPAPRRRKSKKQQDDGLHWDDSGMNITVNPLDDIEKNGGEEEFSEDEDSMDGDSDCSFREEDDLTDEDEGTEVLPHMDGPRSGLEWDDEAALTSNSRSYRV